MKADHVKLALAVVLDILDFTLGRVTGVGTFVDIVLAGIAFVLWGPAGLVQLWEILDPSDQIDGFVPTMTLIALSQLGRKKKSARGQSE